MSATPPVTAKPASTTPDREAFYERIGPHHMAPLWTRLKSLVPKEPTPIGVAHRWRYDDIRPHVMESARLITAEEAERRVLILENPALVGTSQITSALYAGVQLIMPGELAPPHRHTQSALRFVLEGQGAYTTVDGEKTLMQPGDFIITPSWTWHEHGNDSDAPMVWLDGLDIPLVGYFNSTFREDHHQRGESVQRPAGDALARYGSGLMPVGYTSSTLNSPVFNYPYTRTREALYALTKAGAPDAHTGHLMRYVNPVDGGWAMPTMAAMVRLLPTGFATLPYRSSDSMIFVGVEGRGSIKVGEQRFDVTPRDVVVVPGWMRYAISADHDLVLFSYSDRIVHEKLGFFREERSSAA